VPYAAPHTASASADISVLTKVVNSSRNRSGEAWASCSSIRRAGSIIGETVIVGSFFESVVRDHSKDHAVTVTHVTATRPPPNPYTTRMDSTSGATPRIPAFAGTTDGWVKDSCAASG
jgi:hypothetical protein